MRTQRREAGFTLTEMLVTVAIVMVLGAVASAGINEMRQSSRADATAEKVASILQLARMRALSQGAQQVVRFDFANQSVTDQATNDTYQLSGATMSFYLCNACLSTFYAGDIYARFNPRGTFEYGFLPIGGVINLTIFHPPGFMVTAPGSQKQFIIRVNEVGGAHIDVSRTCNAGVCT